MEILKKAKSILSVVAPTLGTVIGSPIGGMAVRVVAKTLLGKENATEQEVSQALEMATPAQLASLKKADQAFKIQMKELEVDVEKIHSGDRDSARKRQIALGDHTPTVLAILTMLAFFGYIGAVTFFPSPHADIGLVNVAIGWLGGTASTVVAYYFGSSSGSKQKNEFIKENK
jgi:hypothetical protein